MFFKLLLVLVFILFLFFIKKDKIESFINCIQKYYNHNVEIHMKDNTTIQKGKLIKSDDNYIYLLDNEIINAVDKEIIKQIKINNCPYNNIYLEDTHLFSNNDKDFLVLPCDKDIIELLMKKDFEETDWDSYKNSFDFGVLTQRIQYEKSGKYEEDQLKIQLFLFLYN